MDLIRIALAELWAHKGRSLAAMTGVLLGVVALIGMVVFIGALTESSRAVTRGWGGFNRIRVAGSAARPGQRWDGFTLADVTALRQSARHATLISPEAALPNVVLSRGAKRYRPTGYGATGAMLELNNFTLDAGRSIGEGDLTGASRAIVLGYSAVAALFPPHEAPIGAKVLLNDMPFTVVGTLARAGRSDGRDSHLDRKDGFVFIPLTTAQRLILRHDRLSRLQLATATPAETTALADEVRNILGAAHGPALKLDIDDYGERLRDRDEADRDMNRLWGLILGLTGVISLLVSAIGITNLLLASIEERVREIGLRKAVGASEWAIASQFLVESVCLCLGGGLLGLCASAWVTPALLQAMVASDLLPPDLRVPIPLPALLTGAIACVAVGLVAGIQPAIHAARLNAIEALRYE